MFKNPIKTTFAALVILAAAIFFVQSGSWSEFSTLTHIGSPDATITVPNPTVPTPSASVDVSVPNPTVPTPSASVDVTVPQTGGTDINRYKTALDNLGKIEVRSPAISAKYDRIDDFGNGWLDTDNNGCDTRNDILKRDIQSYAPKTITYKDTKHCKVNSGDLYDPYTNTVKHFQYGKDTSGDVQVDHMVALKDAWLTGAQEWDKDKRVQYANSPDVLLSVDGKTNVTKGDGICWNVTLNLDVGTCTITNTPIDKTLLVWMPPNKTYWCDYTAKLIEIRKQWGLFMTPQQDSTYKKVLAVCTVGGLF
jgi:hypothetical protein